MRKSSVIVIGDRWWEKDRRGSKAPLAFAKPVETPFEPMKSYTIAEVAGILRCDYSTVRKWVVTRTVESMRIGRDYRILGKKIAEFVGGAR